MPLKLQFCCILLLHRNLAHWRVLHSTLPFLAKSTHLRSHLPRSRHLRLHAQTPPPASPHNHLALQHNKSLVLCFLPLGIPPTRCPVAFQAVCGRTRVQVPVPLTAPQARTTAHMLKRWLAMRKLLLLLPPLPHLLSQRLLCRRWAWGPRLPRLPLRAPPLSTCRTLQMLCMHCKKSTLHLRAPPCSLRQCSMCRQQACSPPRKGVEGGPLDAAPRGTAQGWRALCALTVI